MKPQIGPGISDKKKEERRFIYNGEQYTVKQLASISGLTYSRINRRIRDGWSIKYALEKPVRKIKGVHV